VGGYYPVFLDVRGRRVVVLGAGRVAARKIKGLEEVGARVRVIAPRIAPGLRGHEVERRKYRAGDLKSAVLVFAATDDRQVNHAVAMEARQRRIPVNVADCLDECTFIVPARITQGEIQIAISTGGKSPRTAKQLRQALERLLKTDG